MLFLRRLPPLTPISDTLEVFEPDELCVKDSGLGLLYKKTCRIKYR